MTPSMHPNRVCHRRDRFSGFTLIELLLVVTIIGLLIGLVVPALSRARQNADAARCLANLNAQGKAINMWANENGDRMPRTKKGSGPGDITGLLQRYIPSEWGTGTWECPQHGDLREVGYTSSYGYNWQWLLEGAPFNGWGGFNHRGIKMAGIRDAATTVAMIDIDAPEGNLALWSYVQRPGDTSTDGAGATINGFGVPGYRHFDKANTLWADGHAEPIGDEVYDDDYETLYWDPSN